MSPFVHLMPLYLLRNFAMSYVYRGVTMVDKINKLFLLSVLFFTTTGWASGFDDSVFSNLDYGLYWAGADNEFEKAGLHTQDGSSYYDPTKPTLIYIHGWKADTVENLQRDNFYNTDNGRPDVDFAQLWRSYGFNIGILYWNQFADEDEVKNAESKIWSADANKGIRWLDSDGQYHENDVDQPVAELLLSNYLQAMNGYQGSNIRFAGHSLGSQLAIRLTYLLHQQAQAGDIADNLVPKRITLLDAFFSNYAKSYLRWKWTGEVSRELLSSLIEERNIAVDSYRTSALSSSIFVGDENAKLHNMTAFCEQDTSFFDATEQSEKHSSATWLYLWSIAYSEPEVEDSTTLGVSAAADNQLVIEWMQANKHIIQSEGGNTKTPSDNSYQSISRL